MELIIAGLIGFLILSYLYLTWNYNYWKKRGIPQLPNQIPGIGDMLNVVLQKRGTEFHLLDIYNKFPGHKVCGYYKFLTPALMVRDPQLIKTILISDFSSFHDNDFYIDEKVDPITAKNPFFARGSKWKTIRGQIIPSFTTAKFRTLFPLVRENFKYLNKYIDDHIGENIEVKDMASKFAIDNVASVAYGIDGGSFNKETQELYKFGVEAVDDIFDKPAYRLLITMFPKIARLLKIKMIPDSVVEYFDSLFKQTERYRQENNIIRNDFLQSLLNLRKESKKIDEQEYTYEHIIAHSLTFFVDGFETSATIATFALYELAIHPDVQDKLRDEFLSLSTTGSEIDYDTLVNLPYLDKTVSETLRKYSVLTLKRVCTKDTTLEIDGKQLLIERGTPVTVPAYSIHHDPQYYENPEVFDPERFSEESSASRHPQTFLVFGDGPRICLGQRFGLLQIKSLVYNVVSNYRIQCSEQTVKKLTLDEFFILPKSVETLWVKLEKL